MNTGIIKKYVQTIFEALQELRTSNMAAKEILATVESRVATLLVEEPALDNIRLNVVTTNTGRNVITFDAKEDGNNDEIRAAVVGAWMEILQQQMAVIMGLASGYRKQLLELRAKCCLPPGTYRSTNGEASLHVTKDDNGGFIVRARKDQETEAPVWRFNQNGTNITV